MPISSRPSAATTRPKYNEVRNAMPLGARAYGSVSPPVLGPVFKTGGWHPRCHRWVRPPHASAMVFSCAKSKLLPDLVKSNERNLRLLNSWQRDTALNPCPSALASLSCPVQFVGASSSETTIYRKESRLNDSFESAG